MPDQLTCPMCGRSQNCCQEVDQARVNAACIAEMADEAETRLREAEAHLWALVVWFGGEWENHHTNRDLAAAAAYVERYLKDEDMTARHRAVMDAGNT